MSHAVGLRRFLRARRVPLLDIVVAIVLVLVSNPVTARLWWIFGAMLVVGLFTRHRWPLPALVLAAIGATAHQLDPYVALQPIDLAVPIILYTLASHSQSRWIPKVALGIVLVGAYVVSLINVTRPGVPGGKIPFPDPAEPHRSVVTLLGEAASDGLGVMLILVLAFAWGDGVRRRREHLEVLGQRAADVEREHRQGVALATAAERIRLTREMHDVIAHSLTVIVAQAQAAVAAQRRDPGLSAQAMREVITVGRTSLAEMRQLLGALRPDSDDNQGRSPPVGVGQLDALVDRVRAAGTPVEFDVDGDPVALPTGLDLSVYRIVQEALTNTLKHAGAGARADVRLAFAPDHVEVEVTDDGAGVPADRRTEPGNGLRGIAERVRLFGGESTIGPVPEGGFTVRARLPIRSDGTGGSAPLGGPA